MAKETFDTILTEQQISRAAQITQEALETRVSTIINVGTNVIESMNSVALAAHIPSVYATIGLHPTDCTTQWKDDLSQLTKLLSSKKFLQDNQTHKTNKIVGIGECGIDRFHTSHANYNLNRQIDAFRAQIELSLEYDIGLVVHSRNAPDETLTVLDEYRSQISRGIIHCFSYDLSFAHEAISMGFVLGIGGTITYPNNKIVRAAVMELPLSNMVLETDAPFLPPQEIRGKQNHPKHIYTIAAFIAQMKETTLEDVAQITTINAQRIFNL